jgi:hypothetical protein
MSLLRGIPNNPPCKTGLKPLRTVILRNGRGCARNVSMAFPPAGRPLLPAPGAGLLVAVKQEAASAAMWFRLSQPPDLSQPRPATVPGYHRSEQSALNWRFALLRPWWRSLTTTCEDIPAGLAATGAIPPNPQANTVGNERRNFFSSGIWRGGARRNRTDDLFNAIEALSQLSYGPTFQASRLLSTVRWDEP